MSDCGCHGPREKAGGIPARDEKTGKSVGQMSFVERLDYGYRLRVREIQMGTQTLEEKQRRIRELDLEFEKTREVVNR